MKKSSKNWIVFNFDPPDATAKNGVQKTSLKKPQSTLPITKKRSFNFHLHLAPKTIPDLAVHSKKIAEVETWLQMNVINTDTRATAKYLLVTGPAGSGKTATIRVLCNKMNISLTEWLNPMDQDFEVFSRGANQVTRFREFLTDSKWNSLFADGDKKVILVEEFPNALIRNHEEFQEVLEECYYKGNFPVIFISTDSVDNRSNLSQQLFPEELRVNYSIANISFNACAPTLMKTALKRAYNLVRENLDLFKVPSQNSVNGILATAMGDIRSAVNQYYFASLIGTSDIPTNVIKPQRGVGNKRKRTDTSSTMSRDETLGLFHGLGRVLNPKRTDTGRLDCNMEKLIDEFSIQPSIFTAFLFENYTKYFGDADDVFTAAETLSLSQIFLDKWVDHHDTLIFALWVSVMGLMICNQHRVSRWNQIKGPVRVRKRLNNDPQTRNLSMTDLFYFNIITNGEASRFNSNSLV